MRFYYLNVTLYIKGRRFTNEYASRIYGRTKETFNSNFGLEVDTKGKMSYDNRIWDDKLLVGKEKMVMMFLTGNYSYQYGVSFITMDNLKYILECNTEGEVRNCLNKLERKGYIKQDKVLDRDIFYIKRYIVPEEVYYQE